MKIMNKKLEFEIAEKTEVNDMWLEELKVC